MNKIIIQHWAFRLLTPPIFAFFIYILILLFFDSALQLFDNLISIEYFICLILTYINFEIWRLIIQKCQTKCTSSPFRQIFIQVILSLISALLITAILIWAYFTFILGIISFTTELIIFCSLFSLAALLYNMVFTSQFLLNYQHQEIIVEQEKLKKDAIDNWQRYQNKINPNLLYQSLEQIIGYAYSNTKLADEILMDLTKLYRHILDYQDELTELTNEIELLYKLKPLLEKIHNGGLEIEIHYSSENKKLIVPGLLILKVQQIINAQIVNKIQPLKIKVSTKSDNISIYYKKNKHIIPQAQNIDLSHELETLNWYTKSKISEKLSDDNIIEITIPLIQNKK